MNLHESAVLADESRIQHLLYGPSRSDDEQPKFASLEFNGAERRVLLWERCEGVKYI